MPRSRHTGRGVGLESAKSFSCKEDWVFYSLSCKEMDAEAILINYGFMKSAIFEI